MNFKNLNNIEYDAWLHWYVTSKCNINCEYCFGHSNENFTINKIDIEKLISTLEKSGKIFRISFTGGEPFLIPNFVEACSAITEKHYISLNSHLLSKRIEKFAEIIEPKRVLVFHASLHLDELERLKSKSVFINHFHLLKEKGFNIYAEAVAYPKFANRVESLKSEYKKEGIEFTFGSFYGEFNNKRYPDSYTEDELKIFGIDKNEFSKFYQKNKLCNAGYNVGVVYSKGNIKPCFQIKEDIGNIYEEINFNKDILKCSFNYCGCPLNEYDTYLFNKAIHRLRKQ